MTREQIQQEALNKLKINNYTGTICLSTGSGKGKVAIDAIKEGDFDHILITSPRTNLKEMWKKELEKWSIKHLVNTTFFIQTLYQKIPININIENIQTCYKWEEDVIKRFGLIIVDEAHLIVSPEYGRLIRIARKHNVPVIGLTATPSLHDEFKEEFYSTYIPIIYEYYDSANDGIINKRRYYIYKYELSNDYTVIAGTKKKPFTIGEKDQYEYLSKQLKKGQILMAQSGSQDWFRDAADWAWKNQGTPGQKSAAMTYLNAIKYRKEFLWNLSSSANIAIKIKNMILNEDKGINTYTGDSMNFNKVLLFSELTTQANRLSNYSVHSKNNPEINQELIKSFDDGEIRELSSVRSLTLGLNLKGANWAIIESFNSSPTDITQKMGRTDRLSIDDVANVVILVPINTQAEQWFTGFSKSLDLSEAVYINNINEIKI